MNKSKPVPVEFDFDTWANLFRSDPSEFERQRQKLLDDAMEMAADRVLLQRMQWRIDMERKMAKTPSKTCARLLFMMRDTVINLGRQFNKF